MKNVKFNGEWHAGKVANLEDEFLQECAEMCENREKFIYFKRNPIFCKVIGNDIRTKQIEFYLFQKKEYDYICLATMRDCRWLFL